MFGPETAVSTRTIHGTCTSVLGKSCQLRFLRLGGVMSGFCFSSSHWDHTLQWLGFKIVMPKSSETETQLHFIFQFEMSLLVLFHDLLDTLCVWQRLLQQCYRGVGVRLVEKFLYGLRAQELSTGAILVHQKQPGTQDVIQSFSDHATSSSSTMLKFKYCL